MGRRLYAHDTSNQIKTSLNKRDFQIFIFVRAPSKISLLKMLNAWKRRYNNIHSTKECLETFSQTKPSRIQGFQIFKICYVGEIAMKLSKMSNFWPVSFSIALYCIHIIVFVMYYCIWEAFKPKVVTLAQYKNHQLPKKFDFLDALASLRSILLINLLLIERW